MSSTRYTMSWKVLLVNAAIIIMTAGGWLLPFGLYCISAGVHGKKPSLVIVAMNTFLTIITLSTWLIPLAAYYLWKIARK